MRLIPRRRRVRQPGEARTAAPSAFRRTEYVGSRTVGLWLVAEPVGARWERPDDMTAEAFDAGFATFRADNLANELAAKAYGGDYPAELEHYGMTTWWTLGQFVTTLVSDPGTTSSIWRVVVGAQGSDWRAPPRAISSASTGRRSRLRRPVAVRLTSCRRDAPTTSSATWPQPAYLTRAPTW